MIERGFSDHDLFDETDEPFKIEKIRFKSDYLKKTKVFLVNKYTDDWIFLDSVAMEELCNGFTRIKIYRRSKYTYKERLEDYPNGRNPQYDKALISDYTWYKEGYNLSRGYDSTYVRVQRKDDEGERIGVYSYIKLECKEEDPL